jgi:hypothetical protein
MKKYTLNEEVKKSSFRSSQNYKTVQILMFRCIQHVSEISTLILTSDSSRQEQQNLYVSFFRNIIFHFSPP